MAKQITLNIEKIQQAMLNLALDQSKLANRIGVSKQAISAWLKNNKLPEPLHLLKLAEILHLNVQDIYLQESAFVHNFKLPGRTKQKDLHNQVAKDLGTSLQCLLPIIENDFPHNRIILRAPQNEYNYIQIAADSIRTNLCKSQQIINENDIFEYIKNTLNTVVIPVLWGDKDKLCEALHISFKNIQFLYINLNSKEQDLKFWLLHEMAHLLSPTINENDKEQFANKLAGSILFSKDQAEQKYNKLKRLNKREQFSLVIDKATELEIDPYTIILQINQFAEDSGLEDLGIDVKNLYRYYQQEPSYICDPNIELDIHQYFQISKTKFKTKFFNYLKEYLLNEEEVKSNFVMRLLNVPFADAVEIYQYVKYEL
jgi:DNA-binding XRE family transcriptional regulator